jgi:hypothetical protein
MNIDKPIESTKELNALKDDIQSYMNHLEESKAKIIYLQDEKNTGFTEDVEEWKKTFDGDIIKQACKDLNQEVIFDDEISKNATGFALGPVVIYKRKMYQMFSRTFGNLEEIKEYLKDKKYILYLIFLRTKEHDVDALNMTIKKLETHEKWYIFRGCLLDQE